MNVIRQLLTLLIASIMIEIRSIGLKGENMKYLKYLVSMLVVSSITCMLGVKANSSDPYVFRHSVPPFNGSVNTYTRTKQEVATQELRYTEVERQLDVVLQDKNGNNMSPWKTLSTKKDVIFNNDNSMLPGVDYRVFVDSRINYVYYTYVTFKWWIH